MSELLWIVVTIVVVLVSIPLLAIFAISYLRAIGPHSKTMAKAQAQLDKKTGANSGVPQDVAKEKKEKIDKFKWIKSNITTVLVVIVGAVLVYWGFQNTHVRPADVGSWGFDKWLPLLILWGIIAALIVLNAESGTAKTLQLVLAGVMVALLVVFPLWHWIEKPSAGTSHATRSEVPLASSPQSTWPKLVIPAGGRSELIPVPQGMHVTMVGGNKFRLHTVYQDGSECAFGDSCPISPQKGVYAKNEATDTNIVSYAYVQD
jgi:hypothetical protein